jgi:ADP-ribosylglycohydrolase
VNLAKQVKDDWQQAFILAGILTATNKFIDPEFSKRLKEWLAMTQVARLFFEDGRIEGRSEGRAEIAKEMIADGKDIVEVMKYSKLSYEEIEQIQFQLRRV